VTSCDAILFLYSQSSIACDGYRCVWRTCFQSLGRLFDDRLSPRTPEAFVRILYSSSCQKSQDTKVCSRVNTCRAYLCPMALRGVFSNPVKLNACNDAEGLRHEASGPFLNSSPSQMRFNESTLISRSCDLLYEGPRKRYPRALRLDELVCLPFDFDKRHSISPLGPLVACLL
jgi:hypothetical protein